jgi:enoyl-CoA hydratase/carnithine racemase
MAIGLMKRAVQTGADLPLEAGLTLERELQARLFASADAREGISAYVQRRGPVFSGR